MHHKQETNPPDGQNRFHNQLSTYSIIMKKIAFLKLGFVNPLPEGKLREFLKGIKKLIVIEEGDPVIEKQVRSFAQENFPGINIFGKERKQIVELLKNFSCTVTGHRGFKEAVITAGGVALDEVSPKTLESKLKKGLYFAGEVLNLDANTGGYNLQIAFSTGWLAAESVANSKWK